MGEKYLVLLMLFIVACTPIQTIPADQYTQKSEPSRTIEIPEQQIEKQIEQTEIKPEIKTETKKILKICSYGEESESCKCTKDNYYCPEQKKCIPKGTCCVHSQCPQFNRCVPTIWSASLCIKQDSKKLCKQIVDNDRTELFTVLNQTYKIKAINWSNDSIITLQINEQTMNITINPVQLDTVTIYHEGIEVLGGYCKEDED